MDSRLHPRVETVVRIVPTAIVPMEIVQTAAEIAAVVAGRAEAVEEAVAGGREAAAVEAEVAARGTKNPATDFHRSHPDHLSRPERPRRESRPFLFRSLEVG